MGSAEKSTIPELAVNQLQLFPKLVKPILPIVSPRRIVVLMGGWSDERDISLSSGKGVVEALKSIGHHVVPIDPSPILQEFILQINSSFTERSSSERKRAPDVVFNALHGKWGEDGVCQAILETLGIPCTHSNSLSSALAMNKKQCRSIAKSVNVRIPNGKVMSIEAYLTNGFPKLPHVLKPIDSGSSNGIVLVKDIKSGQNAARNWSYGKQLLIEEYIPGKELSIAVFNGEAVGMVDIVFENEIFDINSKYIKGLSQAIVSPPIHPQVYSEAMEMAKIMHNELSCSGVTRSDFRYDDTNGEPGHVYFLELNTQPGLTPTSLVPKIVKELYGWSYEDVVQWIVDDALKQQP